MKVLLDTCVWGGVVKELEAAEYDVVWGGNWQEDPGDEEILAMAYRENRVLVTLDKDFGELAILRKLPHSGIIRLVNFSVRSQGQICLYILKRYHDDLTNKAIITVEPGKVRIRSG